MLKEMTIHYTICKEKKGRINDFFADLTPQTYPRGLVYPVARGVLRFLSPLMRVLCCFIENVRVSYH